MRQLLRYTLACGFALALGAAAAAETIELRLKDGSRWKGEISDHVALKVTQQGVTVDLKGELVAAADWHITILTDVAGEKRRKTIFKDDILEMKTVDAIGTRTYDTPKRRPTTRSSARPRVSTEEPVDADQPGVLVLPLEKMVGVYIRHEEMEAIAEEADRYGPGQIIVFVIDSGGGAVVEMEKIHATLTEIKKRHRLVAWIKQAMSAACATAMHCDEIYFMKQGMAGAMTAYSGATGEAWKDEELDEWLKRAGDWAEQGGRSRYIAEAMIDEAKLLSYDKDRDTGEITFYNDLSGETVLSGPGENLVFTASSALDCGFADGIANNEEKLAELLDLPQWYEVSDYGRRVAEEWYDTVDRANSELRRLYNRLQYAGTGSGDRVVIVGKRIQILQEILRWEDRCPNVLAMRGFQREQIEREIKELRKQLADMKRRP